MKITINYPNQPYLNEDLNKAIRVMAKSSKLKLKDIDEVKITDTSTCLAISLHDKNGNFLTSCAY